MAEVFLAQREQARGVVSQCIVKRILPGLADQKPFAQAFIDEARLTSRLTHPNLVGTLDFAEDNGTLFLVLEHVDGPDLSALGEALAQKGVRMPVEAACFVLASVLRGLSYAHNATDERGRPLQIVHRDVNPPNILLYRTGAVKLADFGIAHAAVRLTTTRFGQLKGKIPYMSPEQADGKKLDAQSDLFSCGVVLYEMLVGGRLFGGASDMEALRQVREADIVAPSTFRPEVSEAIDRICLKALARNPNERYRSAAAFLQDLEAATIARLPHFGPEQLAALIQKNVRPAQRELEPKKKTAVFKAREKPAPAQRAAAVQKIPVKKIRPLKVGILLLILVACALLAWQELFDTEPSPGPLLAPQTSFTVRGGHGAFVLLDGILLGRSPVRVAAPSGKKQRTLSVHQPGFAASHSGVSIRAGAEKSMDFSNKWRRAQGTLLLGPEALDELWVDGVAAQSAQGLAWVDAGVHRVVWKRAGKVFEKIIRMAPGQTQPLE